MKQMESPQVNITIDELENVQCECGSKYFQTVVELKIIPKVIDPNLMQDMIKPILGYMCVECGKIKEEF